MCKPLGGLVPSGHMIFHFFSFIFVSFIFIFIFISALYSTFSFLPLLQPLKLPLAFFTSIITRLRLSLYAPLHPTSNHSLSIYLPICIPSLFHSFVSHCAYVFAHAHSRSLIFTQRKPRIKNSIIIIIIIHIFFNTVMHINISAYVFFYQKISSQFLITKIFLIKTNSYVYFFINITFEKINFIFFISN